MLTNSQFVPCHSYPVCIHTGDERFWNHILVKFSVVESEEVPWSRLGALVINTDDLFVKGSMYGKFKHSKTVLACNNEFIYWD